MKINYHHLSLYKARKYKNLWETIEFTFAPLGFTEEMITAIVSIAVDLCGVCRSETASCVCDGREYSSKDE